MKITFGRVLSLGIAIGYMVALIVLEGRAYPYLLYCLIPLYPVAMIWFPDEFGFRSVWSGGVDVDEDTPPIWVSILGWLFLVVMPFIFYFCFLDN